MAIQFSRREALLLTATLTIVGPEYCSAESIVGKVSDLTGNATASIEDKTRPLSVKAPVLLGDLVGTGVESRLGLALGSNTSLRLGAETKLRIESYIVDAGGELDFNQGTMLFDREPRQTPGNYRVNTPYGLIAVRGTRFVAGSSNGKFAVFVSRGKVEVSGGGASVLLTSGMGTDFATQGAQPSVPVEWKQKRVDALFAQVL
ncbi:MAG: FecR family protein [Rhodomicrobium sp.]|jgi:ferric-dicitrate binding protein FerR (iron transport regulator)